MEGFEILEKLGDGAYSIVYKVKRKEDSNIYALKISYNEQLIYFEIKEKNSFVKDEYNFYINLNELGNINRFFNQFSDCKGSI